MAAAEAMAVTLKADFGQFEKAMLKAQNSTDAKLHRIETKFARTNRQVKADAKGMGGVFGDLQRQIGGAAGGLPGLGGGMTAVGVAGGVASVGVLALVGALRGVQDAAKFAADLTDAADRIGVTVEALQELRYIADETGVPLNDLDKSLEALNGTLGAFKTGIGAGRITPIFEALGLTQADLAHIENARDLLPILADRLGQVSSRAEQVQLARKLGIEPLLPLLRQGSDNLNRMAKEGRDLGLVLSGDVVKGLDETDRALEKNKQQIDANVREMQASLAPFFVWATGELAKLARGLTDFFNGMKDAENRSDRVLEDQIERGQRRVNFAMRQQRDTGVPMSQVAEGWIKELAEARAELSRRRAARAAEEAPSAAARTFALQEPTTPPSRTRGASRAAGRSGPSAEDLDRQREVLRIQASIELLREQGREREARSQQMTLDTMELTQRYQAAGVANAEAEAKAHVEAVARAQDAARAIVAARDVAKKWLDMAAVAQASIARETARELGFRAEIASLEGDPAALARAERALFVHQRTNELLADRPGLITAAQAAQQAGNEWDALDDAGRRGRLRTMFRETFRDGIGAAIDRDLDGLFMNLADRFTDRLLDNLADDLFDLLSSASKSLNGREGGGGILGAILGGLTGARATGGPVRAGGAYLVGEKRPEVFVPHTSGTIIPSINAAMAKTGGGGRQVVQVFTLNAQGAILSDRLMGEMQAYAAQAATQAGVQAYTAGVARERHLARRQRQLFRLGT